MENFLVWKQDGEIISRKLSEILFTYMREKLILQQRGTVCFREGNFLKINLTEDLHKAFDPCFFIMQNAEQEDLGIFLFGK